MMVLSNINQRYIFWLEIGTASWCYRICLMKYPVWCLHFTKSKKSIDFSFQPKQSFFKELWLENDLRLLAQVFNIQAHKKTKIQFFEQIVLIHKMAKNSFANLGLSPFFNGLRALSEGIFSYRWPKFISSFEKKLCKKKFGQSKIHKGLLYQIYVNLRPWKIVCEVFTYLNEEFI